MSDSCFNLLQPSKSVVLKRDLLSPEQQVSFNLGEGYSLVSTERIYQKLSANSELNLGRRFSLKKDNLTVYFFDRVELGMADAVHPTVEYLQKLFGHVRNYLEKHVGKEMTERIQKNFIGYSSNTLSRKNQPQGMKKIQKVTPVNLKEDNPLDIVRFPYAKELRMKIPLSEKYSLESVEAECIYSLNLGDVVESNRIFTLKSDDEVLREIRIPEGNPDILPVLDGMLRSQLFMEIMGTLTEREGEYAAKRIGTLFLFDSEIPFSSSIFETKPEYPLWTNCILGVNEA